MLYYEISILITNTIQVSNEYTWNKWPNSVKDETVQSARKIYVTGVEYNIIIIHNCMLPTYKF